LFTTACIHFEVTSDKRLLNVAKRCADYLWRTFSPKPKALLHFGFNPSQIMGLVELYQLTNEPRYLELADNLSLCAEKPQKLGETVIKTA
jgi:DUF1680 family protein